MSNFLNVISPDTGEVILASRKFFEMSLRDRGFTPADEWSNSNEDETAKRTETETKNQDQKRVVRGKS